MFCYTNSMKPLKPLRIMTILPFSRQEGHEKYAGIMHYVSSARPNWEIRFSIRNFGQAFDRPTLEAESAYGLDGVILGQDFQSDIPMRLVRMRIPFILLDPPNGKWEKPPYRIPSITLSEESIVRTAVDFFSRSATFSSYVYADNDIDHDWRGLRRSMYHRAMAANGRRCQTITIPSILSPSDPKITKIVELLVSLPKPISILAANDFTAVRVLELCHRAGIRTPEDAALLGVDNEPLVCNHSVPPISSIFPDFRSGGYQAAKLLDDLLKGRTRLQGKTYGTSGVIERLSTASSSPAGRLICKVDAYIRENARTHLNVASLAKGLGISRRLLDLRYRQIKHMSVLESIHAERLKLVQDFLEGSSYSIGEIAMQCGFGDPTRLMKIFRRQFGCTMSEWRERRNDRKSAAKPVRS